MTTVDTGATGASPRGLGPEKGESEDGAHPRGKLDNKMAFMLCIIGLLVGPGQFWTFPFLMFRNGGLTFLIPYFVMILFCGFPMFFLEIALGQYTRQSGVTAWRKICPMFEGVGVASQLYVFYLITYYIVIIAWTVIYLIYSFKSPLPWSTCDNWWNTQDCMTNNGSSGDHHSVSDWSFLYNATSVDDIEHLAYYNITDLSLYNNAPEKEFWRHRVIRMSPDLSLGAVHWDLALCLLAVWIICYFCAFKGIKLTGMVVYLTSTFPYLMLLIIFFRAVTLPGAAEGLKYMFYPDLSRLAALETWASAFSQAMYSFVPCHGLLIAFGSYNKYNNDCYRDSYILLGVNIATSIAFTLVVGSLTGFIAEVQQVDFNEVFSSGITQTFISFPAALANLPGARFWAVLFLLMIFFLCIDTQFLCMESLATAITDMFPHHLRGRRELLVLVIVLICFLLGLPLVTEAGYFIFHFVDYFCQSIDCVLLIACFETAIIGWVYGADRFLDNIEDMIGYRPYPVMKYCWLFVTPLICGLALQYNQISKFGFWFENYELTALQSFFGGTLMAAPLMCIPVYILVTLYKDGNNMMTPSNSLRQARPHKPPLTLCKRVIVSAPPTRTVDERNEKIMMEEPSGV